MKHAGPDAFKKLSTLLDDLRRRDVLTERKPGIFYLKSTAFLHFHDDPAGIFADVKLDGATYSRHRVSTLREQRKLLRRIDICLRDRK